jgi:mRNA-degrading endonuclease RelE of RelBE toxin-antitoxin system
LNILTALHRLAETGAGRLKALKGKPDEYRLRVGDFRVRFTVERAAKEADEDILRIHSVRNRKDAYR